MWVFSKLLINLNVEEKLAGMKARGFGFFAANPDRHEKNFELAKKSFLKAGIPNAEFKVVNNVKHEDMPYYLCASDVLISTSKWEGSPNIIKEAMVCNCPIVATNVGNVKWLLGDLNGHYIAKHDAKDMADKIHLALDFGERTNGKQRLFDLDLASVTVAKKIERIYHYVLKR